MLIKSHHFFILSENPWPLYSSLGSFNAFLSFLIFLKSQEFLIFFLRIILLCVISFYWWFSYGNEFNLEGLESQRLRYGLKFRIILFIRSEVFFFFSFFWSYFHFFLSPSMETGMVWPFSLIEIFDFSRVPLVNTLLLLTSGLTVTIRHHLIDLQNYKFSQAFLALTVFLGFLFSTLQVIEYNRAFFRIRDGTFGTCFFVLTGFHGLHVLIGSIYLCFSLFRMRGMVSMSNDYASFEIRSWYWHFVDVVWLFLFFFLYYLNW